VHTFILSRRTYVNKVIFCGFLFSFIYTCRNTLKLFGNVFRTRIHMMKICSCTRARPCFLKFSTDTYFQVSKDFAKQYTVRYLYGNVRKKFCFKILCILGDTKRHFFSNNTYFGSINYYIFLFFIAQNKASFFAVNLHTCILTM
jgi:hypothetical protein